MNGVIVIVYFPHLVGGHFLCIIFRKLRKHSASSCCDSPSPCCTVQDEKEIDFFSFLPSGFTGPLKLNNTKHHTKKIENCHLLIEKKSVVDVAWFEIPVWSKEAEQEGAQRDGFLLAAAHQMYDKHLVFVSQISHRSKDATRRGHDDVAGSAAAEAALLLSSRRKRWPRWRRAPRRVTPTKTDTSNCRKTVRANLYLGQSPESLPSARQ